MNWYFPLSWNSFHYLFFRIMTIILNLPFHIQLSKNDSGSFCKKWAFYFSISLAVASTSIMFFHCKFDYLPMSIRLSLTLWYRVLTRKSKSCGPCCSLAGRGLNLGKRGKKSIEFDFLLLENNFFFLLVPTRT